MDVTYQAADKDFHFLETQVRELDAERNQSVLTSIFRSLTGTRQNARRRQVTSILPMLVTLGTAGSTVIPSVAATRGMPETIVTQAQEVLATTTNLGIPTRVNQKASVPETVQPTTNTTNKSQVLHTLIVTLTPQRVIYLCIVPTHLHKKTLKCYLMKSK